jgi:hypothetical protein
MGNQLHGRFTAGCIRCDYCICDWSSPRCSLFVALPRSRPELSKSASKRSGPSFSQSGPPSNEDGREANCDARFAGRRKPGGAIPITTSCRVVISILPAPIQQWRSATGSIANILISLMSNCGKPLRRKWQKDGMNNSARISNESVNLSGHRWY